MMYNGVMTKMFTVAPTVSVPEYGSFLVSGFDVVVNDDCAAYVEVFVHDPDGYLQPMEEDGDENERLAFATPQIEMMFQMLGVLGVKLTIDSDEHALQKPAHTTLVYLISDGLESLGMRYDYFARIPGMESKSKPAPRGWD